MSTFTVNSITYAIVASTQNVNVSACDINISGNVNIPSSILNNSISYTVIGINASVFANKTAITSFSLPDSLTIYSGHGPATTWGREKLHNPYIKYLLKP
jgi:hypothetical protein